VKSEKLNYIFKLKLKNTETDFGLGRGVLVTEEVKFSNTKETSSQTMLVAALLEARDKMIEKYIDVDIINIKETE